MAAKPTDPNAQPAANRSSHPALHTAADNTSQTTSAMGIRIPLAPNAPSGNALLVSRIGMGCWPIAGVSTLGVEESQSVATLRRAYELGINYFDTAFGYGYKGESDLLLAKAFDPWPKDIVLATKVGMGFDNARNRVIDGRPETLRRQCDAVLRRLGRDNVEVLYLHLPDPKVDIAESAGAIEELIQSGKACVAGVSNVSPQQLEAFASVCPSTAIVQPPFNMLQKDAFGELQPSIRRLGLSTAIYWVLMKGLLAGKFERDHAFDSRDKRLTYEIYQGEKWQRAQDLLDTLRKISRGLGSTVAQTVVAWTLAQPQVSTVLLGAKRPDQIEETAAALNLKLDDDVIIEIDQAIEQVA